jgi:hypothetical protein
MAEPAALHACAMHAGVMHAGAGSVVHGASHAAHAPDTAGADDAHHRNRTAEDAPGPGTSAPDGRVTCTCLGHCSSTTPLVLGALAPDLASLLPTLLNPGRAAHEYVAAWVDFVLPFATAPPLVLAA